MTAIIIKPEALLQSLRDNLPQIQSSYVRLKGPGPNYYYERELLTLEEENIFFIEFALGRMGNFRPGQWMHACGGTDPKLLLSDAKHLLRWARKYHQLAQAAVAAKNRQEHP